MERLYPALRAARSKRAVFFGSLVAAVSVIGGFAIMDGTWKLSVVAVMICVAVLCILIGVWCSCSEWACRRSLQAMLADKPFAAAFRNSAADELKAAKEPILTDREYRLHLYRTAHWLILISTNCSLIRPVEEFLCAEQIWLENESEYAVRLCFAGGSVVCRCEHICEKLIEKLYSKD